MEDENYFNQYDNQIKKIVKIIFISYNEIMYTMHCVMNLKCVLFVL